MNSILDLGSVYEIRNINYVIIEVYKYSGRLIT